MAQDISISDIIRTQTSLILDSGDLDGKGVDAFTLSIDLKQDRANVSRVLNKMWRDGLLIKFQGKPTLFLDRKLVSEYYPGIFIPQTVAKGELLSAFIQSAQTDKKDNEKNSLDQLSGASGSLREAILQAKTAISYPPYGLHVLLKGPAGAGKKRFAACMHQYKKRISSSASVVPFVSVACYIFSDNPKLFSQQLLGIVKGTASSKPLRGFLDAARGGVLLLDGIETLPPASLSLLGNILAAGSYNRIGESAPRRLECMIIAACSNSQRELSPLTENLPVTIQIPPLAERSADEKLKLIVQMFSEEAQAVGLPIKIAKDVMFCLSSALYSRQILQLSNTVKAACASALMDSMASQYKTLYIRLHNLPREVLSATKVISSTNIFSQQENIRSILEKTPDQYIELNQNSLSKYFEETGQSSFTATGKVNEILQLTSSEDSIDNIYQAAVTNISSLSNCGTSELHTLRRKIFPIVFQVVAAELQKRGKFEEYQKHLHLLYGVLLHITNVLKRADIHAVPDANERPAASMESFPSEYQMAADIMENLAQVYSCHFSNREIDYLASYFAIFSNWISTVNPGLLLICHGETIASDMAGYALKTIHDDYVIDYINFSSSMDLQSCLNLAVEKSRHLNHGSGVLILTDMEPLTSINEYITQKTGIGTHILYPVTLPLLLDTIRQVISNHLDYGKLSSSNQSHSTRSEHLSSQEEFIVNLVDKVISKTAVFIDTGKAVKVLEKCLRATLLELHLPYSNEIAAKYLCHCCTMLERAIRQETWSYSRLNSFTNENYEIMHTVEHKLEYAENIFGIKIPTSEIAYVTEIFL